MKIQILGALLSIFLLSSCSDDPLSESIIGTWDLISIERTGCDDPSENLATLSPDENGCLTVDNDVICNVFLTFSNDMTAVHTVTEDDDTDTEDFTYTVNDDNDTIALCESASDCETVTFIDGILTRTLIDDGCTILVKYKKA